MTNGEAVNWLINLTADMGKSEHRALWHYEQALYEIRGMLEDADVVSVVRCRDCRFWRSEEAEKMSNADGEWVQAPCSYHSTDYILAMREDMDYCRRGLRKE